MNNEQARELANDGLQMVETTNGMNGYPSDLKPAIIGFDDFKQAEDFAQEHGLDLICLHKRDGWQLYQRGGAAYEPFKNSAEDYGDNYTMFTSYDIDTYFEEEVKPFLENFDNFDDLKSFIEDSEKVYDKICLCDDDDIVITYCGCYYETIKKQSMEFYHDTHYYVIAAI